MSKFESALIVSVMLGARIDEKIDIIEEDRKFVSKH